MSVLRALEWGGVCRWAVGRGRGVLGREGLRGVAPHSCCQKSNWVHTSTDGSLPRWEGEAVEAEPLALGWG